MSAHAEQRSIPPMVQPALGLQRLRFEFVFLQAGRLPRFLGSTLRGALGHGLRRVLCVTRRRDCDGCSLGAHCEYLRFFETPAPHGDTRYRAAPHPWTLAVTRLATPRVAAGDRLRFEMSLLGPGASALSWLVLAWQHAGARGLGRDRLRFRLQTLERECPVGSGRWEPMDLQRLPALPADRLLPMPPEAPERVMVLLESPLRLKRAGRLVGPDRFSTAVFLAALRLRLRELVRVHGRAGQDYRGPEMPADVEAAWLGGHLQWQDWDRWSNRQKTHMKLGGLIGNFELDLRPIAPWWPLIWWGQWLQLGKQTAMGLGRYRLAASL